MQPAYDSFDSVLVAHLQRGQVDYGALARDRGPLDRFLATTHDTIPAGWSRSEQIAFWVNVYNARVLDGVIRRPGLKSVLDVGKALGVPTLGFFKEKSRSGGRDLTLNDIEHEVLRKQFHEARSHFVLNCASASCPALPAHPVLAATLDATLEAATRAFLHDRTKNQLDVPSELKLSSIFKWYREDFERASGSLLAFINAHRPEPGASRPEAAIRFLDYDWALNGHW